MADDKLTLKQEAFCQAYVETGNAYEAAARVGLELDFAPPKSGCYVYFLLAPRGEIIYVGKGTKGRMFHHQRDVLAGRISGAKKTAAIRKILESGQAIQPVVFDRGLSSRDAFKKERLLIFAIGYEKLANALHGQRDSHELLLEQVESAISRLLPVEEWRRRRNPTPFQEKISAGVRAELFRMRDCLRAGKDITSTPSALVR